jgi:hypothetical protein
MSISFVNTKKKLKMEENKNVGYDFTSRKR